jgi:hypothetical protein
MMGIVYGMQTEAEEKRVAARNRVQFKSRRQPRVLPRLVGRIGMVSRLRKCTSVALETSARGPTNEEVVG